MLDKIQSYFGLTAMPFGRALAPGNLFRSADHAQAVARIGYGIATRGITVVTGKVGVGKTVAARAAIDRAEPARHHLIYIPDPTVGARCIYHHIVSALGGRPSFHNAALVPQARDALAAEHGERGRVPILCIDEGHRITFRYNHSRPTYTRGEDDPGYLGRPQTTHHRTPQHDRHDQRRNRQLHRPPPQARRPIRPKPSQEGRAIAGRRARLRRACTPAASR
jgi:hypothetical protein